ncbi:MAG: ROK family protein [Anaerolineae bacterium]|jgi:glucokinase|nr:ROK family protein [Anaerolineae bacterium]
MAILAIDFGGTRTRAAWYDRQAVQLARAETPSLVDQPADDVLARIIATARSVIPAGSVPLAIGISAPGPLHPPTGIIHHALTLPGWRDVPLRDVISEALGGAPGWLQNDGSLGALAEYHQGAGRGADPLLYLTLSTGIGGGAVLRGSLFTGSSGLAIEPGHQCFLLPDGRPARLEDLASGTALGRRARELLQAGAEPSLLRQVATVDGAAVGAAAQAGDALARQIVQEAGRWLGAGLMTLTHLFNPQAIVLGGSVSTLGDLLLDPARAVMAHMALHPDFLPPDLLRPAALGDDVCLAGAALYALQQSGLWSP